MSNFSGWARDLVCNNHGEYIQFHFSASELHKRLGLAVANHDLDKATQYCNALESFIERNTARVAHTNFLLMHDYFQDRHPVNPRICIKAIVEKNEKQFVVPLIRDEPAKYESEYALEKNSAFMNITKYGQFLRARDIPAQVNDGAYHNARIVNEKVKRYMETRRKGAVPSTTEWEQDRDWMDCWKTVDEDGNTLKITDPTYCYKSALVIPITLWNNKLSAEFKKDINNKMKIKQHRSDIGRYIFGYICMDHVEVDYFKEEADVDIGYMVADIMSLYMIYQTLYIDTSTTFVKAKHILVSR